ncbi:MAG TPA: hypothetical protein VIT23_06175, partial [Terrimicrobiaceae bacterium]
MKKVFPRSSVLVVLVRFVLLGVIGGIVLALVLARKPWEHQSVQKIGDFVRVYSWWAGLINLAPLTCLALTAGWWTRPLAGGSLGKTSTQFPRWFFLCLAGGMVTCAIVGLPRLGQSLWEDEEFCVRRCSV